MWNKRFEPGHIAIRDTVGAFVRGEPVDVEPVAAGALSGLTCGVKDVFDIAGHVTGYGNPTWRDTHEKAGRHALAVQAVLDAGAYIVGKTNTDELTFSITGVNHHYGSPINTAAPDRLVGGSSSGSAAAVAAHLCDFALGTDTAGSVRVPASFCGLYGLRPSHGSIPDAGVLHMARSFDTIGWLARDMRTMHRVGEVLLPPDSRSVSNDPVQWATDAWALAEGDGGGCEPSAMLSCLSRQIRCIRLQTELGDFDRWFDAFRILQFAELWYELGDWIVSAQPELGPGIADRFKLASTISAKDVAGASRVRQDALAHLNTLLDDGEVLVIPTAPGVAPKRNVSVESMEEYRRTAMRLLCLAGLAGLPQVTLPLLTIRGAPMGISLIGPRGSDLALLSAAESFAKSIGGAIELVGSAA